MKAKRKTTKRNISIQQGKTFSVDYFPDPNDSRATNHKTILVVYGPVHAGPIIPPSAKRYPFNTTDDLRVGDVIESNSYTTPMHVVEVLPHYKYINIVTCELSNTKAASTAQREIRLLVLENARPTNTITARLLRRVAN